MKLLSLFKRKPEWEFGTCNGMPARRSSRKKNVQFVLWKAGEQGHKEDYWHDFNSSWWGFFVSSVPKAGTS